MQIIVHSEREGLVFGRSVDPWVLDRVLAQVALTPAPRGVPRPCHLQAPLRACRAVARVQLRGHLGNLRPGDIRIPAQHEWDYVVGLDPVKRHALPGSPVVDGRRKHPAAIKEVGWPVVRATDDVNRGAGGFVIGAAAFLDVHTDNRQARNIFQLLEIALEDLFSTLAIQLILQQLPFELLEELGFIVAQFRLDPVLRIEKHFSVGFPHPVVLHPLPALHVDQIGCNVLFQIHQAALDEQLRRADGVQDARAGFARAHLDIDQVAVVQVACITQMVPGFEASDQCGTLPVAKAIFDRLQLFGPALGIE